MNRPPSRPAAVPLPEPLAGALARHGGLADLTARLVRSRACFDAVRGDLPESLRDAVQPGPIDDTGWTLIAANAAVASKLRHLLPHLEAVLRSKGAAALPIRIRIRRLP